MSYPQRFGARLVLFLLTIPIICCGLAAVTVTQTLFVAYVQRRDCEAYARAQGMDTADLAFEGVVIATNKFDGHICNFVDGRGVPVQVRYAAEDIPYGRDTAQVMSMVCVFLLVGIVGTVVWEGVRGYLIGREQGKP